MNVNEAIAKWKQVREMYDWPVFPPTAMDVVIAEVERLRAEVEILAVEVTRLQAIEHERIETQTELAAAKAASVPPVEKYEIGINYKNEVTIYMHSRNDAESAFKWLHGCMKDTPPTT